MDIIWFNDTNKIKNEDKVRINILGGKGSSLLQLYSQKVNVPLGYIVTTKVYDIFIKDNNLETKINRELQDLKNNNENDIQVIEKISKRIRDIIMNSEIRKEIIDKIYKDFDKLNSEFVAVRSSANVEDAQTLSWAGQFDSYMFVNKQLLIRSILNCWCSLYSTRAILYSLKNNFIDKEIKMAVIIQEMIESEISGIGFSMNPSNGNNEQMVIEIGFGNGTNLVSGKIKPKIYKIDKTSLTIYKSMNRLNLINSELNTIANSKYIDNNQKLVNSIIIDISKQILHLEKLYNFPIDLEFAVKDNIYYILQVRAITTNKPKQIFNNINNYIRTQKWVSSGNNTNRGLMSLSINLKGVNEIFGKKANDIGVESIIICHTDRRLFRVYNSNQHQLSYQNILKCCNIDFVKKTIGEDNKIVIRAIEKADNIIHLINNNAEYQLIHNEILNFIELLTYRSCDIYWLEKIIGIVSEKKLGKTKYNDLMKHFSKWKNDNAYLRATKIWPDIFKYIIKILNINATPELLNEFIDIDEFIDMINYTTSTVEIERKILERKKNGYIVLNLKFKNNRKKIIQVSEDNYKIKNYLEYLYNGILEQKSSNNKILGQSILQKQEIITGKCIVVKTEFDVYPEMELSGNIFVTTMTTPYIIPYAIKAKAIITDNGGITCHAAIVSREYNINCIVGTEIATHIIKTGDIVEMNMEDGSIKLL